MPRPSSIAQALALLVLGYALVAGEPGVLIGVVGVALCAWELARLGLAVLRRTTRRTAARARSSTRPGADVPTCR